MNQDDAPRLRTKPPRSGRRSFAFVRDVLDGRETILAMALGAGLPPELGLRTTDVVHRTRLWRSEKIALAREMIGQFSEHIARGVDPQELLYELDEPELQPREIRRRVKRLRPFVLRVFLRLNQIFSIFCAGTAVVYALLAWRFFAGTPAITRNPTAEFNAAVAGIPPDQRAWPLYRQARMLLGGAESLDALDEKTSEDPGNRVTLWDVRPGDALWPKAVDQLRSLAPVLDLIRRGAARPRLGIELGVPLDEEFLAATTRDGQVMYPPAEAGEDADNPLLLDLRLHHLGFARFFARLLAADARLAIHEQDGPRARSDIAALIGLAGQLCDDSPFTLSSLVGYAILSIACDRTCQALEDQAAIFTNDDLTDLSRRLAEFQGGGPLRPDLRWDRAVFDDFLQHSFTNTGAGGGRLTPRGLRLLNHTLGSSGRVITDSAVLNAVGPAAMALLADRRRQQSEFDHLMDLAAAESRESPWLRGNRLEDELALRHNDRLWKTRYFFVPFFIPAIAKAQRSADQVGLARDASVTGIALELFRRCHGRYPESLGELAPSHLPSVPADIYDGRPLRYRLENAAPLLYSIGSDYEENGGLPPPGKDGNVSARQWRSREEAARLPTGLRGDWILYPPSRQGNEPTAEKRGG